LAIRLESTSGQSMLKFVQNQIRVILVVCHKRLTACVRPPFAPFSTYRYQFCTSLPIHAH